MKKKLNTAFVLVSIAMVAIIGFQVYWTIKAYSVNRKSFNLTIDGAIQQSLDSCKKVYFDSIRRVLVNRISDTAEIKIKVDTLNKLTNPGNIVYSVTITAKHGNHLGAPITFIKRNWDYYQKKFNYPAILPQFLTEVSFYEPRLIQTFTTLLSFNDMERRSYRDAINNVIKRYKGDARDSFFVHHNFIPEGITAVPPNLEKVERNRIDKYFKIALNNKNISAAYQLTLTRNHTDTTGLGQYSATREYEYKYYGFKIFGWGISNNLYTRAIFQNAGYVVLKSMAVTLLLSALLITLTGIAFSYTIRLILQQKKLADLKDDFINNMTHELKTPIATITVAIEGLQKFNALNDLEKTQRYLQTSRNELNRLNDLVTKVLNIALFENKEIELHKTQVNINDLINDIIASEQLKADKLVSIAYQNKDNIEFIEADLFHFRNVVVNLVDNAVKYAGKEVTVNITCYNHGNYTCVSVKDNGIGIASNNLGLVFDKFYRVPTGNVHNVKGTGLGLSYVKYITKAHGGAVDVKSEINAGTEFIVSIPLGNG